MTVPVGTAEPDSPRGPVVARVATEAEAEAETGAEAPRTRRWRVEERLGRVRLLAQGLFVSAGLAAALIVTHLASASPTTTTTPTGSGGSVAPSPVTSSPPSLTRAPVTSTVAPPTTTTTVCYSTPSGQVTCT